MTTMLNCRHFVLFVCKICHIMFMCFHRWRIFSAIKQQIVSYTRFGQHFRDFTVISVKFQRLIIIVLAICNFVFPQISIFLSDYLLQTAEKLSTNIFFFYTRLFWCFKEIEKNRFDIVPTEKVIRGLRKYLAFYWLKIYKGEYENCVSFNIL